MVFGDGRKDELFRLLGVGGGHMRHDEEQDGWIYVSGRVNTRRRIVDCCRNGRSLGYHNELNVKGKSRAN